jgi:hypothetical protein
LPELLAAIEFVPEESEAGASRGEQHDIAGTGLFGRGVDNGRHRIERTRRLDAPC